MSKACLEHNLLHECLLALCQAHNVHARLEVGVCNSLAVDGVDTDLAVEVQRVDVAVEESDGWHLHVVDVADGSLCGLHLLDRHLNHVLNVLRVAVDDEGDELQVLVVLNPLAELI